MGLAGCFRGLLFVENFIFWLIGVALIVAGAYVLISPELPAFLQILEGIQVICYVAVGMGVVLFIIGFLGCCGAFSENRCLLKTYASLLIVMVLLEIAGAILIWQLEEQVMSFLALGWNALDSKSVIIVQKQFSCCGFNDVSLATPVPLTCLDDAGERFQTGCYDKLREVILENIVISASVAGAVVFLQIICIIVSCILGKKDKPARVHPVSEGRQAWGPAGGYS